MVRLKRLDQILNFRSNYLFVLGVFGVLAAFQPTSFAAASSQVYVALTHMTTEYLSNPEGIDVLSPRFSWEEISNKPGYTQHAYRLIVSSTPRLVEAGKGDLWDSGKIASRQTTLIAYAGAALKSRTRCWWRVEVWDNVGNSPCWSDSAYFSMGLLKPQDWKGVWIGKDTSISDADLSVLKVSDWIWYPEANNPAVSAPIGERYFRTNLNVPSDKTVKRALFVGTADNDFQLDVNGVDAGFDNSWYAAVRIDITKLLRTGSNVLAVTADNIGVSDNPAGLIACVKVDYTDGSESTIVPTGGTWLSSDTVLPGWQKDIVPSSAWHTALDLGKYGIAPWGDFQNAGRDANNSGNHSPLPARYLRREFTAEKRITNATAYVCGLGFFQLYVNGQKISDHMMDPALSDYRKADYYVTFNVTNLIKQGSNCIGVILGNARFYSPRSTSPTSNDNTGMPRLLMQLELTYSDGTTKTISTDSSWMVSDEGPIRANNEYDGEVYDARMALGKWAASGYTTSPSSWSQADILPAPGGTLCAQMIEPMRITGTVDPVKITSPKPGVYEVDMGQTFYGTVRLTAHAPRGDTVDMTSAYDLLSDGTLKTADNRTAIATESYTFAGDGTEIWNPIFKGQGYRHIQVTGFPTAPKLSNFEGLKESTDVRPVGSFSCSNALVNEIHQAMREGMLMFLRSAPLDPDRDERQAWMGDPAKDSESEAFNFDVAAFYTKWMDDVRRSERSDGSIPDVAMYWPGGNGIEWPSVFTIIPDWYTGFYADNRLEARNYDAMKHWVLAMKREHGQADGTMEGAGFADWCDAYTIGGKVSDYGQTPHDFVSSAYQYNNIRIMQHAAQRLGKTEDAVLWRSMGDSLRDAFLRKFYDPTTHTYTSGTQCSYVLPLAFGLVPDSAGERKKIVNNLANDIMVTHDGHLTVGLLGNQWLMQVLSENGRPDVAWRLITQTTRPSWGYMIKSGSSTIWERWDYDTRDPGMNSKSLLIQAGNVDAWLYQTLAGINYDPARPGFAHILIKPQIVGDLIWVKCHFDSPHGNIVSSWTRTSLNVVMNVTIPSNTSATVTTPDGVSREVGSGSWTFKSRLSAAYHHS
jgi:alpha-L-rhamnosidase